MSRLTDLQRDLPDRMIQPEWFHGIPKCRESCPSHDGKRCEKIGFRAPDYCEPAIEAMARGLDDTKGTRRAK